MPVDVIIGLQWGDEGKGKIVDILAPAYQVVARYQGGPNAGHTLVINGKKFVFHTLPSGVVHDNIVNVLGPGMVIDPVILKKEILNLQQQGISLDNRLKISGNVHLITPAHRALDKFQEEEKGKNKIGSTLKGISPAYQDKYGRSGLTFGHIFKPGFDTAYNVLKNTHLKVIKQLSPEESNYEREWFEAIDFIRQFEKINSEIYLNELLARGGKILAEGAQGTLLDITFGTYPYVTSSNTISSGACTGLGVSPGSIGDVYGVFKAYTTRVGEGPFPTEQLNATGEMMRDRGLEFGSTTGRPRRCGWLDLIALKYSVILNGVTKLAITKSDVLTGFEEVKACVGYADTEGKEISFPDFCSGTQPEIKYASLTGWQEDFTGFRSVDELPGSFMEYLAFIEKFIDTGIDFISVGPGREQTIIRS